MRYRVLFSLLFGLALVALLVHPVRTRAQEPDLFIDSGQSIGNDKGWRVSLGDLDGDDDLDAFVANVGPERIWLNDGTGVFSSNGQTLGGSPSFDVDLGDLDGDDDIDAIVVDSSDVNRVWLNDGAAIFSHVQSMGSSSGRTDGVALGDLDGDDDLDAFMVNNQQPDEVWFNNGAGTFADSGQRLGSSCSHAVELVDVDGDDDLDAFVANGCTESNMVWLNDGAGVFTDSGQRLGNPARGLDVGDIDGDNDPDAFFAHSGLPNTVWVNDGVGNYSDSGQALGGGHSMDVDLGDVDGDGDLDAFAANRASPGEPDRVWLNDGTGVFSDSGLALGNTSSEGVALGDIDDDGDLDAFVANGIGDNIGQPNKVWLNTSDPLYALVASPLAPELYPGDSLALDLEIQDAQDLYAAQAACGIDPAVLELQSVVFGDFFDPVNRLVAANEVSPTLGTWFGAISQQNPAEPLSGDGLYATLTLEATGVGTTTIACDPLFSDRDGFTQTLSYIPATITVLPYATITGTATYQGRLDHSGIEVVATGPVTRTDWTDAGGAFELDELRAGDYNVRADAGSYLPSCITVTLAAGDTVILPTTRLLGGDLTDDEVVNIGDATLLTANFGETVPPADTRADINADGAVNVQDLAILAGNYEETGCQPW